MSKKPKFCILTSQRSGSTLLANSLHSHPQIQVILEAPFLERPGLIDGGFPRYCDYRKSSNALRPWVLFNYLDSLDQKNYEFKPYDILGYKLMYNQIKHNPEVLIKLISDKYRIIHLARRNVLDIVISSEILRQHGINHVKKSGPQRVSAKVDTSSLIRKLDLCERTYQVAKIFLKLVPLPVLEITYDSLAFNRDETLRSIADFLQVDSESVTFECKFKKANPGTYRQKITNYEQVAQTLKNTKYEHLLAS